MGVLQTETGFVSLCHFSAIQTQQVIVGENLHTVEMSGLDKGGKNETFYTYLYLTITCSYLCASNHFAFFQTTNTVCALKIQPI